MAEWATAADALRRRQVKKMTNKELSAELAKVRKRLNRRMRELERTGYYKYSGSYTRLENYIRSDLGGYRNVLGQWEFTTKPYAKATRRAREELLIRWQHFQDYQGLTSEEVKQSLEEEAKKLNEMTESNNYNIEKVKNIRDMMAEWREDLDSAITSELFDSTFARKFYEEHASITPEQRYLFLENMENTFMSQENHQLDQSMKPYFRVWLDNYNFTRGRSELSYGNISFNPASGDIYDIPTNYKMEIDSSTGNKIYYLISDNERKNIDEDIGVENLYDFLLNNS